MALIPETGDGLPDANSYTSIEEADAYLADREAAAWFPLSDYQKTAGLIEATAYLDGTYTWVGKVQYGSQALGWPRVYGCDHEGREIASDAVPAQVARATALLAVEAAAGRLQPSTTATSGALKRKRVGPLELEYFEGTAGAATARSFPAVSGMLRGLTRGGPGDISGSVVRWS